MAKDDPNMPAQQGGPDRDTNDESTRGGLGEDVRGIADESDEDFDEEDLEDEEEEEDEGSF